MLKLEGKNYRSHSSTLKLARPAISMLEQNRTFKASLCSNSKHILKECLFQIGESVTGVGAGENPVTQDSILGETKLSLP